MIAAPTSSVAATMIGLSTFGRICLKISELWFAPMERAASTNSRLRSESVATDVETPALSLGGKVAAAGIVGGAIIPLLQGALSDRIGIQHSFVIPLVCYAFIVWYGFSGSRIRAGQGRHANAQASGVMH